MFGDRDRTGVRFPPLGRDSRHLRSGAPSNHRSGSGSRRFEGLPFVQCADLPRRHPCRRRSFARRRQLHRRCHSLLAYRPPDRVRGEPLRRLGQRHVRPGKQRARLRCRRHSNVPPSVGFSSGESRGRALATADRGLENRRFHELRKRYSIRYFYLLDRYVLLGAV